MKKSVLQTIKSAFNLSYLALIVLFCFAISTSFMSINYMAKYKSIDGNFDVARVAKFDISASVDSTQSNNFTLTGDNSAQYLFKVISNSDVAVEYDVVLEFPTDLSDNLTVKLDDGAVYPSIVEKVCTFSNVGSFAIGETEKNHTLTFKASQIGENNSWSNVSVKVVARQID